ncbi:lipid droplet-associated hydrolase-like isoform X1 [Halictus rubicundus]|uniref:lipid droplet-associated hydrolase-like isoform X1 n=2 Tax=Halictus rubicundus TaxID=77578 RepID=UPI0040362494
MRRRYIEGRKMIHTILMLNDVPTPVIAESCWTNRDLSLLDNKDVIIIIPGNPGIPEFYTGFINSIKSKVPAETPIWLIGHSGHVQIPDNLLHTMPSDSLWLKNYSLMAQVEHKKLFIKKYVPEDVNIHLVAHSIGAWIALQLLKDDAISKRIKKCYLLFPTIENMSASPNGQFFNRIVWRIAPLLIFLCWILSCLPLCLQHFLINLFAPIYGVPKKYSKAVHQFVNPRCLRRVLKLANEEMQMVKERDDDILSQHTGKLWFYYGNRDGWTPLTYYKSMKSRHPDMNAEVCKHGYYHSFVLKFDKEMGCIVGDLINKNIL